MNPLPLYFVRNITAVFEGGAAWLETLPAQLEEVAAQWNLTIGEAVPNLSFNYVCFATRTDGMPAVLKMGVPRHEFTNEVRALQWYNGEGAAWVLEFDAERGWVLLERIVPGTPVTAMVETDDDTATHIAAELMQQLWRPLPPDHPFIPMSQWSRALPRLRAAADAGTSPFSVSLVARAEATFALPVIQPVLLHADFHHDNILLRHSQSSQIPPLGRGAGGGLAVAPLSALPSDWVMIDAQGIAGPALYDVGPFLDNPLNFVHHHPNLRALLARRVAILAEHLNVPRDHIIEWGIAYNTLSSWWNYEDIGADWEGGLLVAETLAGFA